MKSSIRDMKEYKNAWVEALQQLPKDQFPRTLYNSIKMWWVYILLFLIFSFFEFDILLDDIKLWIHKEPFTIFLGITSAFLGGIIGLAVCHEAMEYYKKLIIDLWNKNKIPDNYKDYKKPFPWYIIFVIGYGGVFLMYSLAGKDFEKMKIDIETHFLFSAFSICSFGMTFYMHSAFKLIKKGKP